MQEFYDKVAFVCSNFLLYGNNVKSVYKPVFNLTNVIITVTDTTASSIDIVIEKKTLCSLHGFKLSNYVVKLMQEYNL